MLSEAIGIRLRRVRRHSLPNLQINRRICKEREGEREGGGTCLDWVLNPRVRFFLFLILRAKYLSIGLIDLLGSLYCLLAGPDLWNTLEVIKSRILIWGGHLARMEEGRSVFKILSCTPTKKRPLRRPRGRWKDSIRMHIKRNRYQYAELGCSIGIIEPL